MQLAALTLLLSLIYAAPISSNLEKRISIPTAKIRKINYASMWKNGRPNTGSLKVTTPKPVMIASNADSMPNANVWRDSSNALRETRQPTTSQRPGANRAKEASPPARERPSGTVSQKMVDRAYQKAIDKQAEYDIAVRTLDLHASNGDLLLQQYRAKQAAHIEAKNAIDQVEKYQIDAKDIAKSFGENSKQYQDAYAKVLDALEAAEAKKLAYQKLPDVKLKDVEDALRQAEKMKKRVKELKKEYDSAKAYYDSIALSRQQDLASNTQPWQGH